MTSLLAKQMLAKSQGSACRAASDLRWVSGYCRFLCACVFTHSNFTAVEVLIHEQIQYKLDEVESTCRYWNVSK